ncbi:hypothetical protein C0J52_25609 [Blattella germanica]|nr:hypothetical protein C0J52_25609 [Blattella germanica]
MSNDFEKQNEKRHTTEILQYYCSPQLLYGSETWTHRRKDINKIEESEMRFLRAVKGCTRLDKIRSADIRTELKITESAVDKVQKYKTKWKTHKKNVRRTSSHTNSRI